MPAGGGELGGLDLVPPRIAQPVPGKGRDQRTPAPTSASRRFARAATAAVRRAAGSTRRRSPASRPAPLPAGRHQAARTPRTPSLAHRADSRAIPLVIPAAPAGPNDRGVSRRARSPAASSRLGQPIHRGRPPAAARLPGQQHDARTAVRRRRRPRLFAAAPHPRCAACTAGRGSTSRPAWRSRAGRRPPRAARTPGRTRRLPRTGGSEASEPITKSRSAAGISSSRCW